ncbi:MAG TPA: family 2B encapsulin nanocompartment shell protein [Pseudonocardiaceae bacterium]|nr:family 2B encapsulin nanocompartment shell protein [Pseudonocardiaceae bacterium]
MTTTESSTGAEETQSQLSLGTAAARNLATTTKTEPQMQGITSRWLLKILPWVQVSGGVYRVNRRLAYTLGDGRIEFDTTGAQVRVIPQELTELPAFRGFADVGVLGELASRFEQREFEPGDVVVEAGRPADQVFLIAHGKLNKIGAGKYGDRAVLGVLADGEYFGDQVLVGADSTWEFTVQAVTTATVLALPRDAYQQVVDQSEALRSYVAQLATSNGHPRNEHGEIAVQVASGHEGEPELPGTFVEYEAAPREYELSVAQTVLRVHSRVADLFNEPMDQVEQQLRLTIESLRERQEHELVNNPDFGLLNNADFRQRIHTRSGPPTPDDLDELLATVWKEPSYFLAHPRAIAAFGRECSRRGIYPSGIDIGGHQIPAWRGIPLLPCNKIPVNGGHTTSIMLLRTGEANQGIVGLHQVGLPDEYQPGLSVRFMGINSQAVISYLVSAYYSAAVLVPDALGILENVEVARSHD